MTKDLRGWLPVGVMVYEWGYSLYKSLKLITLVVNTFCRRHIFDDWVEHGLSCRVSDLRAIYAKRMLV